jgi:rsbT co-antagonist protein RsbR
MTGVDTVDTATANHLLTLIRSIRLIGARGIVTGIRPTVAQTMVSLGVELGNIVTLATLRDGLKVCMTGATGSASAV